MSAERINLKSKPLVAGVLCVLAIVACINVMVFRPGQRSGPRQDVRVQSSLPVPADLGDFIPGGGLPDRDLAAWSPAQKPALQRDPFGRDVVAVVTESDQEEAPIAAVDTVEALVCNAILLGGSRPAAVINGRRYRLGERIREYEVAAIGRTGVKLVAASGDGRMLSVKSAPETARPGRIVNESTGMERLGETSLVNQAGSERK